jgi:hypothetical protein
MIKATVSESYFFAQFMAGLLISEVFKNHMFFG